MKGEISAIVGENTNLLVLVIVLASDTVEMYMLIPSCMGKEDRIYRSKKLHETLGELYNHILFLHAMTGCDTTSAPNRLGKNELCQKLREKQRTA